MDELDVSALPGMLQPHKWEAPAPAPIAAPVATGLSAQVGQILVTRDTVQTPIGTCPLKGAYFSMMDMHQERSKFPTWTIVCSIIFFPLGLLALLCKTNELYGYVNVTVANAGFAFTTQFGVNSLGTVLQSQNQVAHLQSLAQWAAMQL